MVADTARTRDSNANATRRTCWAVHVSRIKVRARGHQPLSTGRASAAFLQTGAGPMSLTRKQFIQTSLALAAVGVLPSCSDDETDTGSGSPSSGSGASGSGGSGASGSGGSGAGPGQGGGGAGPGQGGGGAGPGQGGGGAGQGGSGGNPSADALVALSRLWRTIRTRARRLSSGHRSCGRQDVRHIGDVRIAHVTVTAAQFAQLAAGETVMPPRQWRGTRTPMP